MQHSDFHIGTEFRCADRTYRCTDVGTRTAIAIRVDRVKATSMDNKGVSTKALSRSEAESQGWFDGPPYAVAESVFDEDDLEICELFDPRAR
jgi:hypothetical protein